MEQEDFIFILFQINDGNEDIISFRTIEDAEGYIRQKIFNITNKIDFCDSGHTIIEFDVKKLYFKYVVNNDTYKWSKWENMKNNIEEQYNKIFNKIDKIKKDIINLLIDFVKKYGEDESKWFINEYYVTLREDEDTKIIECIRVNKNDKDKKVSFKFRDEWFDSVEWYDENATALTLDELQHIISELLIITKAKDGHEQEG